MAELKKSQSEINLKANALQGEHFQTDASGHLVIKNAELSHLIQTNVAQSLKGKAADDSVSVGVVVSVGAQAR